MRRDALLEGHKLLRLSRGWPIAYRDLSGPPGAPTVVLLHGIGMTADLNWAGSFATLRRRFRVIAPDLVGHGLSGGAAPNFRLEDCADDVAELATALGIERFVAVGYSMGGLIAQLLWRRHREVTSGLVLCASSRNFLGTRAERMTSLLAPAITVAARFNPLLYALGAGILAPHVIHDLSGEQRQYALTEMNRTSMTTVAAALVASSQFTSHEWIGEIDVPVSVLIPTRDTIVPPGRQRRLAQAIPHATVFTVDGDHSVCISDPARFSPKLLEASLATQATVTLPSRSATQPQVPGAHRTAADAG